MKIFKIHTMDGAILTAPGQRWEIDRAGNLIIRSKLEGHEARAVVAAGQWSFFYMSHMDTTPLPGGK